jgi:small subunit ribosomal protein S6
MVIFYPGVDDEGLKAGTDKYSGVISAGGGEITRLEKWGKRKLAYEIDDRTEGFYFLYRFRCDNSVLDELGRQMRIDERVLRHMVVRDELATGKEPKIDLSELAPVERAVKEEDQA